MGVRKLKAITPGQRFRVLSDFSSVTESRPEKSSQRKKRSGGRNSRGKMTVRNIGGGHKQRYRLVDFKREKFGIPATVKSIEYDPNRNARIALLFYADGEKRYIIAQNGLQPGQQLMSGEKATPDVGNALFLKDIPLGTVISCIEMRPGQGAMIARSGGAFAQLSARDGKYAIVKMPSGESRMILTTCLATIGVVSNLTVRWSAVEKQVEAAGWAEGLASAAAKEPCRSPNGWRRRTRLRWPSTVKEWQTIQRLQNSRAQNGFQ